MARINTVECYEDKAGEFRFRVLGGNGEIVAASEGDTTLTDCLRGVRTLERIMADRPLIAVVDAQEDPEPLG